MSIKTTGLRPTQSRGIARYEAILQAAAELLAEVGYEAVTLTAVAVRSNSAIPSLYRFFPNREALFDALTARIAERIAATADAQLVERAQPLPIEHFVSHLIDNLVPIVAAYPGISELVYAIESRHSAVDALIQKRLTAVLKTYKPLGRKRPLAPAVHMTMAIIRAGMRLLARTSKAEKAQTIAEIKFAVTAYLGARFASPAG